MEIGQLFWIAIVKIKETNAPFLHALTANMPQSLSRKCDWGEN